MRRLFFSFSFSFFFALAGCSSTTDATQLIVVVDTNLMAPMELDEVTIVVTGPSAVSSSTSEALTGPGAPPFPLSLTVLPEGEALGPVTIAALGSLGGMEVVRSEVTTHLTAGESKTVRLLLLRGCIGRPCAADQTCAENGCTLIERAAEDLEPFTTEPEPFSSSDPCVETAWDQDDDGQGAVTCGGMDCNDLEGLSFAGGIEECDGIDNDCDGSTDEDCDCAPLGSTEGCTTMCGSMGSRTCGDAGVWGSCAATEICNGIDDDCDGDTDEGFDYAPVAPRMIGTAGNDPSEPYMAFAEDRFHVTYIAEAGSNDGIHYLSVNRTGDSGGAAPFFVERDARRPRIAWSGTDFGLVWWDPDVVSCGTGCSRTDRRVNFAVMDTMGVITGAIDRLESAASNPPTPRVVWNGTGFAASWYDSAVYLQTFDAAGARTGTPANVESSNDGPHDMIWTGSSYAFLISRNKHVYFNQGTPAAFLDPSPEIHNAANDVEVPVLVKTDSGFFVAWAGENGRVTSTAFLNETGELTSPVTTHLPAGADARDRIRPQIAAAPGQLFLVLEAEDAMGNKDLYFARFRGDGTELQALTRFTSAPSVDDEPTIAYGGGGLAVTYLGRETGEPELYFTSLACAP